MINPFPIEDPDLDAAIASAYADLKAHRADSTEYAAALNQLSKLYKLRNDALQHHQDAQQFELKHSLEVDQHEYEIEQNDRPFWQRVDPNTALTVTANLAIGLIVVKYEQTGVIRTVVRDFMKKI